MLTLPQQNLLTAAEVAARLGVTEGWVRKLLRYGKMKGHKAGRWLWLIPESEIQRFVDKPRVGRPRSRLPQ